MRTVLKIFKRDFRRAFSNRAAALIMVGVSLLPSLYAWFNIAANIDPYANTQGVKVAIANCDVGKETEPLSINAGENIVESLKKNDKLGWTFVSDFQKKTLPNVYASLDGMVTINGNLSKSIGAFEPPPVKNFI